MEYKRPLRIVRSEWERTSVENRYLFAQVWAANIGYALAAMPGIDLDASLLRNAEIFFEPNALKTGAGMVLPLLCTQTAASVAGKGIETVAYLANDAAEKGRAARLYARRSAAAVGRACSAAAQRTAMICRYITHS